MNLWLLNITMIVYVLCACGQMAYLINLKPSLGKLVGKLTWGGFILHTIAFVSRFIEAGYTPVTNLHESYSFFSWCLVLIYLVFQHRYKIVSLGAFVMPLVVLILFGAIVTPGDISSLSPALQSWWLPVHVAILFIGDGAFALAAIVGLIYLIQERQLKKKKLGALFNRLPNIEVLDEINYRCLTIGFPLLTLGIISGAAWAQTAWGTYWSWDPKETWSLITWFLYAGLLHGRLTVGWRGRRAAIWSIIGFGSVLFTFLGVNYILPLIIPDLKSLHIYTG
jgi:cytochrome c-type biogenesis protein CcsB